MELTDKKENKKQKGRKKRKTTQTQKKQRERTPNSSWGGTEKSYSGLSGLWLRARDKNNLTVGEFEKGDTAVFL